MAGPFAIDKIIHDKGQFAGESISIDKKPQDPMIESIGFRIRAHGQTYGAIGSHASPVSITTLHFTLPLGHSANLDLITALDGL